MESAWEETLPDGVVEFVRRNELQTLLEFLYQLVTNVIIPVVLAVFFMGRLLAVFQWFGRLVVPQKAGVRYRDAKIKYRQGKREEALEEWTNLKKFGPAYLSRAVHALYVEANPQKAMKIIRLAKEAKVRVQLYQVDKILDDAKALQNGVTQTMLDMNARLAKQEYLGIAFD